MSETGTSSINRRSTSSRRTLRKSKSRSRPASVRKSQVQASRNAFFNFLRDYRRQNQGMKVTELTRQGAQTWRQMNTGEKSHYWQLAKDTQKDCSSCRKGRARRRRAARRRSRNRRRGGNADGDVSTNSGSVKESQRTLASRSSRTSRASRKTKGSRRSVAETLTEKKSLIYFTNPFLNFVRDYNLRNPKACNEQQKDRVKLCGEIWRKMSDQQKKPYKDMSHK